MFIYSTTLIHSQSLKGCIRTLNLSSIELGMVMVGYRFIYIYLFTINRSNVIQLSEVNIQMSFSPISLKFEVDQECSDMQSKPIMSGQFSVTESNLFSTPEEPEDLEDMEELTDVDVYSTLAQYGYQLGDEFQTIVGLLITTNGTYLQFINIEY